MLLSLVDLYKEKSHIFELHGAAYEELNKFATRHEDGAYEKYKDKVYKPGNQKKEQTRINARAAKRIISKLKSEDKIRLPHLKGKENLHAYADEHIYGAVENAIKSGKRVLLITNDIDLSIRCMSIKDNFIDDQGALNFPSPVVCQGNLINMLTLHHRLLKEELKSRKLETSDLLN